MKHNAKFEKRGFNFEMLFYLCLNFVRTHKTNRCAYVELGKLSGEEVAKCSEILQINHTKTSIIIDSCRLKYIRLSPKVIYKIYFRTQ
jgi:hypothetical protein